MSERGYYWSGIIRGVLFSLLIGTLAYILRDLASLHADFDKITHFLAAIR